MLLEYYQKRAEKMLPLLLPKISTGENKLNLAMQYAVLSGGKRLRPILVYLTGCALGGDEKQLDMPACAIEYLHCYSLIHDDLPAMDNDDLRRGKASCHIQFDEATAILAGDALQSWAFTLLSDRSNPNYNAELALTVIHELSTSIGVTGMASGQILDLENANNISLDDLKIIHELKTASLFSAAVRIGAITAKCDDQTILLALNHYAKKLGLAFQIQDDLLDKHAPTSQTGKQQGSDSLQDKITYASFFTLDEANTVIRQLIDEAKDVLAPLEHQGQYLKMLADYILVRNR